MKARHLTELKKAGQGADYYEVKARQDREVEALKVDAERYRAKREIDMRSLIDSTSYAHANNRDKEMMRNAWLISYDAAIDAARKEAK